MGFYIEDLPIEFNGITMQEADYLADEFLKDTPCNRMWDAMRALRDFYETVTSEAVDMADRKTENSSEIPNNFDKDTNVRSKDEPKLSEIPNSCKYAENPSGDVWECGCFLDTYCEHQIYDRNPDGTINIVKCGYEPKGEPQYDAEEVAKDINRRVEMVEKEWSARHIEDEPQTDTEIAKAIIHKMIDDAVIAEDAYPDLRQKMHDAVDEYEPQERSE